MPGKEGKEETPIRVQHAVNPPKYLNYKLKKECQRYMEIYSGSVQNKTYRLCEVVFHDTDYSSEGMSKGHYYIDIMNWFSGAWFGYDEHEINPLEKSHKYSDEEKRNVFT